ncbi:hypothetical protein GCM10007108_04850 [Thermogymnomonas acidicola]|uniref:Aldehyde dehydrogenase domain-containing protein n=1 Tax=Thermogymnomonas acidicola TaxID=399579 RepID=A0AA37BQE4_9ARCH|nr:hypothetical protein GCM10007108_04850 [Thermogymnomonas acidicola]
MRDRFTGEVMGEIEDGDLLLDWRAWQEESCKGLEGLTVEQRMEAVHWIARWLSAQPEEIATELARESGKTVSESKNELLSSSLAMARTASSFSSLLALTGSWKGGERYFSLSSRGPVVCRFDASLPVLGISTPLAVSVLTGSPLAMLCEEGPSITVARILKELPRAGLPVSAFRQCTAAQGVADRATHIDSTLRRDFGSFIGPVKPVVVLVDGDNDRVASDFVDSATFSMGQAWASTGYLFAPQAVFEYVKNRVLEEVEQRMDLQSPQGRLGAFTSERRREAWLGSIQSQVSRGAVPIGPSISWKVPVLEASGLNPERGEPGPYMFLSWYRDLESLGQHIRSLGSSLVYLYTEDEGVARAFFRKGGMSVMLNSPPASVVSLAEMALFSNGSPGPEETILNCVRRRELIFLG